MQKNNSNQPPYLLIADSGSTKTAWCRAFHDGKREVICTRGINPAVQNENTITTILREDLMPLLSGVEEEGQPAGRAFLWRGVYPFRMQPDDQTAQRIPACRNHRSGIRPA